MDRETFTVSYRGQLTAVHRYPISIEWPPRRSRRARAVADARRDGARSGWSLPPDHALGVGVDRLDYTKGILERFRAVERLLELEPQWIGQLHVRADRGADPRA